MTLSITQAVGHVLAAADRPLTIDEILVRTERLRPVESAQRRTTMRNALGALPLAVSLGGRPASYVWWPHALAGSVFRQPLAGSDPASGPWLLHEEVFLALWPTFFADRLRQPTIITLVLPDEVLVDAQIGFVQPGPRAWGILPAPALAAWLARQNPLPGAALIVRVLDVASRRYAVELEQPGRRHEPASVARNRALTAAVAEVLAAARDDLPDYDLIPRLVARGAYRDPLPPDPLEDVLRSDMGFIIKNRGIRLVAKLVDTLEREIGAASAFDGAPRPAGARRSAQTEDERRAWGEYLFDQGMECRWAGWQLEAEAYYREALCLDSGHADAWVHLGNICRGCRTRLTTRWRATSEARRRPLARTIGDPATYEGPFWLDLDSRPYMRALHGKGCCFWRLGRTVEARRVFAQMLRLNPNDNQGARFLLDGLDRGRSWEEEAAWEEQAWGKPA